MHTRPSRRPTALSFAVESLEGRVVLSATASAAVLQHGAVEVAAQTLKDAATQTSVAVHAGTLAQPVMFSVTVKGPASAGSPQGTVRITDHGQVLTTIALSPTTSASSKFAASTGAVNLTSQPGGGSYYFGKHAIVATFVPSGSFAKSSVAKTFTVPQPIYTTLTGGTKTATVIQGSGPQIQSGQTANVLYTGYLAKTGQIFDDSLSHGGTPLSFPVGEGQVVPGFDAGTLGMQVGESRVILIPPSQGYGSTSNGTIPANSTLVFVVTLQSIS